MSIRAIQLRNFRGFKKAGIELKPLTVLLGPNSAGKSSFGHALSAMAHCQWSQGSSEKPSLTPGEIESEKWPVDLGSLDDLRTCGVSNDRVYVGLTTDGGEVEYGFGLVPPPPRDSAFSIGDLVLSYISHPGRMHPGTQTPKDEQRALDAETLTATSGSTPVGLENVGIPTNRIALTRRQEFDWWDENANQPAQVGIAGLVLETMAHSKGGTPAVLSGQVREVIRKLLRDLTYLRATRERPTRTYASGTGARRRQLIDYGGEWTAALLNTQGSTEQVRYAEFPELPKVFREPSEVKDNWTEREYPLALSVAAWLKYLHLADSVESVPSAQKNRVEVRVTVAGRPHNLTDVGFGVSQILPVLTAGLMNPADKLLIVDLPEAHLHPDPEVKLADFFCSLALTGRTSLIETHSQLFFHRLRLRTELHPDLRDKVAVYFIDQPKDGLCCEPRRVNLGFEGEPGWPAGFFQEGYKTEVQISSLRRAKQ